MTINATRTNNDANEPTQAALRVKAAYRSLGYPQLKQVECQSSEGTVRLQGTIDSFYLKQAAQAIAQRVPGVKRVENKLSVESRFSVESGPRVRSNPQQGAT